MTYATGNITNAASASTFISTIDATLTATTGITKVTSALVVGVNTWNVYKSAAANNAIATDFYFALGYTTATPTTILITIMEGWNSGTNLATNYPPSANIVFPTATFVNAGSTSTGASPAAAVALPSAVTVSGVLPNTMTMLSIPGVGGAVIPTAFTYFYSVTVNRVVFGFYSTSGPANGGAYIGLYDSFMSTTDDPVPLVALNLMINPQTPITLSLTTPTTLSGFATREPRTTIGFSGNFSASASTNTYGGWTRLPNTATSPETYTGLPFISRAVVGGRGADSLRGLLKDIYVSLAQTNNGDTLTWTVAGTPYVATRVGLTSYGVYVLQV